MEEKITKRRSLIGEKVAISKNKENAEKTLEMLQIRIQEISKNTEKFNVRMGEVDAEAEQLEQEISDEINAILIQVQKLEEQNDRYEQEGYENEKEKIAILENYKAEEMLIERLLYIKEWFKIEFGVVRKRRILAKKE